MELLTAAENQFADADLETLREFCERMGLAYHPNNNADTLRKKLTAALGEYNEISGDEPGVPLDVPKRQARIKTLVGYNLKPTGRWEGKRRKIILLRSMSHDNTSRPQFFAWGRLHLYVPFGVECSVPYPIFNILKDTSGKRLERRRRVDEDGRVYYEDNWVRNERFMYTDLGDDLETADRPDSEIDRMAKLHRLTNGYEGFSERQFRAICSTLHLAIKPHWGPLDMKGAIETRCGLSDAAVDLTTPESLAVA